MKSESIVLGGGCFWCLEAFYGALPGVTQVTSGYAGGDTGDPDYQSVCSGRTGHAEVVEVQFDPERISLEAILSHFWDFHDPTTLNRQGNDVGTQYRSIILVNDEKQRDTAEESMRKAQERFDGAVVTEIRSLAKFYPAEDYHQNYYENNPAAPYCQFIIRPKMEKLFR